MALTSFTELMILAVIIGFSIFLSFPIIYARNMKKTTILILTASAVGILIFLLADIFGDVTSFIYPAGSYVASTELSLLFLAAVGGSYGFLYLMQERRVSTKDFNPMQISIVVAIAVGFQNLTEGLVFGATWAVGLTGLLVVIFVGFVLQNFTEGFPIVSPFLNSEKPKVAVLSMLFFIGAVPTVTGSLVGYFYSNVYLSVLFDSLAIGSILFIIVPMLHTIFRSVDSEQGGNIVYLGIIAGFVLGFLVNII